MEHQMTKEDQARVALGAVVGALAAIAITKHGLNMQSGMLRWIAYCVVAGLVVNSQTGMSIVGLALAGITSALGLGGALCWMLFVGGRDLPLKVSGHDFHFYAIAGLATLSVFAVMVCALARPAVIELIQKLSDLRVEQARTLEAILRTAVTIVGMIGLFLL